MINVMQFIDHRDWPGEPIFAKLWGSRSHNTHFEDSDYDFLLVYQTPNHELLSLRPPPDTVVATTEIDGQKVDYQAYEVDKFVDLLLKGNPNIVECLFTRYEVWQALIFTGIKLQAREFLTEQTVKHYTGYARSQLARLKNGKSLHTSGSEYNTKWAYHVVRLLKDAQRIRVGEPPIVWKDGIERASLMSIREGLYRPEEIAEMAGLMLDTLDAPRTGLAEKNPEDIVEDWLLRVRGFYREANELWDKKHPEEVSPS